MNRLLRRGKLGYDGAFRPVRFQAVCADVAQLVEQLIRNQQVIGSSPIVGSKSDCEFRVLFPFLVPLQD